jgi:hypothetical protein
MATYAKVQSGNTILEYQEFSSMGDQSLISPNKPKWLPVVEENATYDPVTQVRAEPPQVIIEAARVVWRYTLRAKTTAEVDQMRTGKINGVHNEATTRLTPKAGAAGSQQLQALTALVQLLYKYTDRTSWSAPDKTTVTNMIKRVQDAQSMRVAEDDKVSELQVMTDPVLISAYDPKANWPAA